MDRVAITIGRNGGLRFIYHDALADLVREAGATVTRASHVEPAQAGGWSADMTPSGGPVLGPFRLRRDALAAEIRWLQEHCGL